jgi:glutaminyl-tRNA synthetase
MSTEQPTVINHFIRNIIEQDITSEKHQQIVVRFPPEPNGFCHIGHAKSICLNFGLITDFPGQCHLRFDDTNPLKEEDRYVNAIQDDIRWLGYDWGDRLYFTSDYYSKLYAFAIELIEAGKAYVDELTPEQMREYRGTLISPGKNSPHRDRPVAENLDLFQRMKEGEFNDGQYTLRAKIDMSASNVVMRDPVIYRILHATHHRTLDHWCIYPMYDFAHCLSDAIEGITHSLCTLEFQNNRPLYDWFVDNTSVPHKPRQIEFSRLNLNYTITSKRKLKQLVDERHVDGWDDPRMPTLSGMRRRGYTPQAIRQFCHQIGVSKKDSIIDIDTLESCVRDDLNQRAPRRMAVLDPIKVIIDNYPTDKVETINVANHPQDESQGRRDIVFAQEIYIDRSDFMIDPPAKYFRLKPNGDVRLRNGYVITCTDYSTDDNGQVTEIRAQYHPETLGGKKPADGRKVKGIIHWVAVKNSITAEVRLYDRLFKTENPAAEADFIESINPHSLTRLTNAKCEIDLNDVSPEAHFQFTRVGYFCADRCDHQPEKPVFNRIVELRKTWK